MLNMSGKFIKSATYKRYFFKIFGEVISGESIKCEYGGCDITSYIYDVIVINFYLPHTRIFYFFAQIEEHHLAVSLLISWCDENFICPVL